MKKNLAVIFGGRSTEHDISIITANQIMNAVDKSKYNLFPIYVSNEGEWFYGNRLLDITFYKNFNDKKLKRVSIMPFSKNLYIKNLFGYKKFSKLDCVIISCHGKNGEDGSIQGLLELAQIPYQSSGILGSAIGLDKSFMKQIFLQNKIPTPDFIEITKRQFQSQKNIIQKITKNIALPVIVKPNTLGSSIGISICKTTEELKSALSLAFVFDNKVLIEKYFENIKEVNISALGDENEILISKTEEVAGSGFLSFDKKYMQKCLKNAKNTPKTSKNTENFNNFHLGKLSNNDKNLQNGMQNMGRIIPANITKFQQSQIEKLAKKIFLCTNSKGVVRIDFIIDKNTGKVYANEINTIPGSFAFYLWENSDINFSCLVDKLVSIAEKDSIEKSKITTTFMSSVLSQNLQKIEK